MNMESGNDDFVRLILALEPWLGEVVIIGGWAHRLYRFDPRSQQLDYAPVMTLDADVAVPPQLQAKETDIRDRLVCSGFHEELLGDDQPPATHYNLGDATTGFYAEFLTPLVGSEHSRDGKRKATLRVAGVVSQRLRYLEILLNAPWVVSLDEAKGFPFPQAKTIKIANPTGFLAHKVLVREKRRRAKFAKDILYIHDTLKTFGAHIPELRTEWTDRLRPQLHARNVRIIEGAAETLFGEMNDSIRNAALIAKGRGLSPEAILEVCSAGLKQVFR
jgi:Nucleotidyltransferase